MDFIQDYLESTSNPKLGRKLYGYYVSNKSGGLVNKARINYSYDRQAIDSMQSNVKKFIKDTVKQTSRTQVFEEMLKTIIQQSPAKVANFDYYELSLFFPWMFSRMYITDPFRIILFALKNNLPLQNLAQIQSIFSTQMINQQSQLAVLQSIRDGASYVQLALDSFSANDKFLAKALTKYMQVAQNTKQLFQTFKTYITSTSLADNIGKVSSSISSSISSMFSSIKTAYQTYLTAKSNGTATDFWASNQGIEQFKKLKEKFQKANNPQGYQLIQVLLKSIYSNLKAYGNIIINMGYLEAVALKKYVNGKLYLYVPQSPKIMFQISEGGVYAYRNSGGTLTLIPANNFNLQYIRQMAKNDVVKIGGDIYRNYNNYLTQTKQTKTNKGQFKAKYLGIT